MEENIQNISEDINLIPKWYTRFAAFIIDGIIIFLASIPFILLSFLIAASLSLTLVFLTIFLIGILLSVLSSVYFAYFHSKDGKSLGMKLVGIELKDTEGKLLSFQTAFLRSFLVMGITGLLSGLSNIGSALACIFWLIVVITIFSNKKQQGFHDSMFHSIYSVTNEKKNRAKWIVGCYCGCSIFITLGLLILISLGAEYMVRNQSEIYNQIQKMRPLENKKMNPTEPSKNLQNELNNKENQFFQACMSLSSGVSSDLTEYCKCAAKESLTNTNSQSIVEKCKVFIKSVNNL
jgi:uncharacterized RDD family membrane protein YckC